MEEKGLGKKVLSTAIITGLLYFTPTIISPDYVNAKGITSYGSTKKYENKNPRKDGRFLNKTKKYVRENSYGITKKLLKFGDPTGVTEKVFDILKRRKDKTGTIPNTGVIRRKRK